MYRLREARTSLYRWIAATQKARGALRVMARIAHGAVGRAFEAWLDEAQASREYGEQAMSTAERCLRQMQRYPMARALRTLREQIARAARCA